MNELIQPHMSREKIQLLEESMDRANHYLEYGMGGSTVLAARKNLKSIVAVDSSEAWVNTVKSEIEGTTFAADIQLLHVNLGETGDWGYPTDHSHITNWPSYYSGAWNSYHDKNNYPDLIFIDGRFRVPCFLYSLLHSKPDTRILWDDYLERTSYHLVESVLQPQGIVDDMVIFNLKEDLNKELITVLLFQNLFNLD